MSEPLVFRYPWLYLLSETYVLIIFSDCKNDFVAVYNGPDEKSPRVNIYCQDTPSGLQTSEKNVVTVRMKTNAGVAGRGFVVYYKRVLAKKQEPQAPRRKTTTTTTTTKKPTTTTTTTKKPTTTTTTTTTKRPTTRRTTTTTTTKRPVRIRIDRKGQFWTFWKIRSKLLRSGNRNLR